MAGSDSRMKRPARVAALVALAFGLTGCGHMMQSSGMGMADGGMGCCAMCTGMAGGPDMQHGAAMQGRGMAQPGSDAGHSMHHAAPGGSGAVNMPPARGSVRLVAPLQTAAAGSMCGAAGSSCCGGMGGMGGGTQGSCCGSMQDGRNGSAK